MLVGRRILEKVRSGLGIISYNLPEIQKTLGVPPCTHLFKNSILSLRSMIQEANGFSDRNPFSAQSFGTYIKIKFQRDKSIEIFTWLSCKLFARNSSSSDITTSPFKAFFTSTSVCFITDSRLLYFMISWTSTVFIDSL